ncbi:uroporphyrinogen-III C-methyltransferase [Mitsuaria sp. GD03876]|uniref:uroporphyrinogen-III C-methyltransferase n=1 Tax=Mitsuaria sp. GD03876 TaxID=2975399 RepID=UPI0024474F2D|nr:uroporphyrinogen-III C-methyltransferase [Mitsuaria sp. GD03876]MDH0864515.1 uroporphyrinogen-III C-methyltransferase [Mitsuaria sp. GD03876]
MGRVLFVSAGPGAADLITLRGARALAAADVVLYDALTDPALREMAPRATWIDVGKRGFCHSTKQTAINAALVREARAHAVVVRLKGGDASIFGRLEEELQALAEAGIAYEVVPGVTAAIAAAAQTGRPLTRRGAGRSVALTTAMTREGELQAGKSADTEVFYMAGQQLAALSRRLVAAGWDAGTPVSVVSRAGCADALASEHDVASLGAASMLHRGRPTVVIVGAGAAPTGSTPARGLAAAGLTDAAGAQGAGDAVGEYATEASAQDLGAKGPSARAQSPND